MPGPLGYRNPLSRFEVTMLAWCESLVRGRGENGQAGPSRGGKKFPARIRMRRMEGKFYLSECRILKVNEFARIHTPFVSIDIALFIIRYMVHRPGRSHSLRDGVFWFKMDAANKAILERTKKTRSVSRSLVTKQINKLESEISNTADKTTVHEIYMQLISKFEELSTLDKEIENLIDIESLKEEIVTREEYRDKFIIWKIRAERYVESVSNTAIQNSVENQPQNITLPLNSTVNSVLSNQPRLPKLTLESFSGKDISSFPSFWARFKSAVHEN
ncbi:DUF1758 domain-containing protein [Trichonephila clavipes]|uniref:DUF1758 domain-containing protein n=1 Tax=Trichonephila clavipes TaxID=2585209 RepID=A0A8X6W7J6_TRICX|nr:DUF1758 domain-containing protein [Trichonephila clavipes]